MKSRHTGTTGAHTGLRALTTRYYRVSAINSAGTGTASTIGSATTQADVTPPTPDSAVVNPDGNRITLSMNERIDETPGNGPPVSAFTVTADGYPLTVGSATFRGNVRAVLLQGLSPTIKTTQDVLVSYTDPTGGDDTVALQDEALNDAASFTDLMATNQSNQAPVAPDAPTGLTAGAVGQTQIDLSWTASYRGASAITGYLIEYSDDGGGSFMTLVATTGNDDTTYSHTGLSGGQTRHYRVSAINSAGTGLASSPASATTGSGTGRTPPGPSAPSVVLDDRPLKLALWTDKPGYLAGESVRLYRTAEPRGNRDDYEMLYYLERAGGGERRYFSPGVGSVQLREDAVDHRGRAEGSYRARSVPEADRELTWEGDAPEPGLWQFVVELRPEGADGGPQRAWAKFVMAERSQLLIRRGFVWDVSQDMTPQANTIYCMGNQLYVSGGATLRIEAGTLVRAYGPQAAIVVEPGGRIEAEGTREAPVTLTCSSPTGTRSPGCWGGLRLLGRAPVTRIEGDAAGVPTGRDAYGGTDPEDSSGSLRHVRIEFAGAGGGAGSATILEHVQAHTSLAEGILFSGRTAGCSHCVASSSGTAGLAWERGWQGTASHLYVQHDPEGGDGLSGENDSEGYDQEPRSKTVLSNVTLVHASPYGRQARRKAGLRLRTGTAVSARDLLVTRFGGGAIDAGGRAALLFGEGESSVASAILYRNGSRLGAGQLRGDIVSGVEFEDRDPMLRNIFWEANPDPRPEAGSPALSTTKPASQAAEDETATGGAYVGAFG